MNCVNLIFDIAAIYFEMKDVEDAGEEAEDGCTSWLVCYTSFASFDD